MTGYTFQYRWDHTIEGDRDDQIVRGGITRQTVDPDETKCARQRDRGLYKSKTTMGTSLSLPRSFVSRDEDLENVRTTCRG